MTDLICPLCKSQSNELHAADKYREYYVCNECHLIFVPSHFYLSEEEEKRRYSLHNNDPADSGYRKFLSRLMHPLRARLKQESTGLDYGSGPGPTLSLMFEESGFRMNIYDPFFANEKSVLRQKYDFVTCTEAAEHFHDPSREFEQLNDLLKDNGWLGVMTQTYDSIKDFVKWHYIRDETHVCFFSRTTFEWISRKYNYECEVIGDSVILMKKGRP